MRYKNMKTRRNPLNLGKALVLFGKMRRAVPESAEACKLGQQLIREVQHLHKILRDTRRGLPPSYSDYIDPQRLDKALARTVFSDAERTP